jgi:DNA-binding transcriptional LysR family regulator
MLNMEVVERVAMDEADIGLVLSPDNYRGSTVIELHKTELIGIVPVGHPLAAKGHIDLEDAMRFPLISFSRLLPLGAALDRLFQQRGQQRRVAIEVSHSTTALSMVRQGIGIALVDRSSDRRQSEWHVRLKLTTSVHRRASLSGITADFRPRKSGETYRAVLRSWSPKADLVNFTASASCQCARRTPGRRWKTLLYELVRHLDTTVVQRGVGRAQPKKRPLRAAVCFGPRRSKDYQVPPVTGDSVMVPTVTPLSVICPLVEMPR